MGIYVNPGNTGFREAVNSAIYVDKSELISYTNDVLNTKRKNMCVSRPRRFGKSMAADMLVAYYSRGCDSGELFAGRKTERLGSYKKNLNKHHGILQWEGILYEPGYGIAIGKRICGYGLFARKRRG